LRVLGALISAGLVAAACSASRRSWSGLAPGACAGWFAWIAYAGAQDGQGLPMTCWLAGLAGMALLLIAGKTRAFRGKAHIDIPWDSRILVATSTGFLLRGLVPFCWMIIVAVTCDYLAFGVLPGLGLSKPPKA
jgi:hypothetical protein